MSAPELSQVSTAALHALGSWRKLAIPMRRLLPAVWCGLFFALLGRAEVQRVAGQEAPNEILPRVFLLSPDWAGRIPPTGQANAPEFFTVLHPGQRIALGLMAKGPDRDRLFDRVSITVRLAASDKGGGAWRDLKPVTVRPIKAEGADFALLALKAAGIGEAERGKLEKATTLVTLAVFTPEWTVPMGSGESDVELRVDVAGAALPVAIEPIHLRIRTVADWAKEPPLTDLEVSKQMNRFRGDIAPGQLLAWFGVVAKSPALKAPPVHAFFAFAFKANPAARAAAVEAYPTLDPETQPALLWVLRLGGADLSKLLPTLPADALASFNAVDPLPDPRRLLQFPDPVSPQAVREIGNAMDRCWAGWMATGDKSYLRELVGLLEGAADYPAYKSWQETRGGVKGLNARVARGLAYQIAGWSISSFQRTDPLVADWLQYWQSDPAVPEVTRREIAMLPTNPAFKRQ
jgi:hypothetical protein